MSDKIKGEVEATKKNDYGFWGIKVNGEWYGAGKSNPRVSEGDSVSFFAFENDKGYQTIKGKVTKLSDGGGKPSTSKPKPAGGGNNREDYWTNKAVIDAQVQPRITYQGAYKIAGQVAEAAVRLGFFPLIAKAKEKEQFDLFLKLVEEIAERIFNKTYLAVAPKNKPVTSAADEDASSDEQASEESSEDDDQEFGE